jgi:hypothetical protein
VKRLSLAMPLRAHAEEGMFRKSEMVREAHALELLDMGGPGDLVGLSAGYRDVMIIAGQGTLKAARKPQRAKGKGALAIGDMVQHLPDAPFIGRVTVQRFFFGDRREQALRLAVDSRARQADRRRSPG